MATRMGNFGGTGTSTAALDVLGAHVTGWSSYTVQQVSFVATSNCTLTVNGVDALGMLANVPVTFDIDRDGPITSLAITEADVVYWVGGTIYGTKA